MAYLGASRTLKNCSRCNQAALVPADCQGFFCETCAREVRELRLKEQKLVYSPYKGFYVTEAEYDAEVKERKGREEWTRRIIERVQKRMPKRAKVTAW